MLNELLIGERLYSSWSLRGWLSFAKFDLPVKVTTTKIYQDAFSKSLQDFVPARLVPAAKLDGALVWDSLAIVEELNARHPDKQMWPRDPTARALARSLVAEMHAGFSALRSECPMNLHRTYRDFEPSTEVLAEAARVEVLWKTAREMFGQDGPWLFGRDYTIADVFYAPVATRFVTYALPRGIESDQYIQTHLQDPLFRQWRAMGLGNKDWIPQSEKPDLTSATWPGPVTLAAKAVDGTDSENTVCPYSGKPVTHVLEITENGRRFGFCNRFCRDKTVQDPLAWPGFVKMYEESAQS